MGYAAEVVCRRRKTLARAVLLADAGRDEHLRAALQEGKEASHHISRSPQDSNAEICPTQAMLRTDSQGAPGTSLHQPREGFDEQDARNVARQDINAPRS
eukprot:11252605-Alexandrium_andersonii.AAC.2